MTQLISKPTHSALTYILLLCSFAFATSVSAQDNDQTTSNECSFNSQPTSHCLNYVKGYLSALQQLNNAGLNSNFSDFEVRAFKTRVGNSAPKPLLQEMLNLCLSKEISASDVLTSIDHSLPLESAILKVLQSKYHC